MDKLAREIEAYLASHPDAADTIEGIVRWWLARQRYQQTREEVRQALEYLVVQGVVAETKMYDGRILYARADRRGSEGN